MKKSLTTIAALLLTAGIMSSAKAQIVGENYSEIRVRNSEGWTVQAFFNGNNFHSCGATTSDSVAGMDEMILEYTGFDWQIGRNDQGTTSNYQGRIFVGAAQDTLSFEPVGPGRFVTVAFLQRSVVSEIKRGSSLTVQWNINDSYRVSYSLAGSTAAMLKTEECFRNQGRKRVQQTQPRPNTVQPQPRRNTVQPQPRRNTVQPQPGQQNNVPHKTQLSGTWIWSDPVKHSKNNLIVSTIKITGNNTLNYCYGVFCWDVNFSMNARNEVTFSTNGTDKFVFYDDGPNALHGEFWEFGNSFASPDARVDLR